jgi:hypothetical protein
MDQRKRREDFYNKLDRMIVGKRPRKNNASNSCQTEQTSSNADTNIVINDNDTSSNNSDNVSVNNGEATNKKVEGIYEFGIRNC